MEENQRRTAADVLIQRFLQDVEELGTMPWQRPYQTFNAFNWYTKKPYRGFNRLILPFGEYLTRNQINLVNKEQKQDYRFAKGIKWYPIAFFTQEEKEVSYEKIIELSEGMDVDLNTDGFLFVHDYWTYFRFKNKFYKRRNVLKFYEVADRKYFVNSKGECLPSKIEMGEVELTFSKPKDVIDAYIDRSGVSVNYDSADVPNYIPALDLVNLNPYSVGEEEWFSTAFHEFGHSTGASFRLNREGITHSKTGLNAQEKKSRYAVEECIAEICAALCCSECGISTFSTSESKSYENSLAYVKAWKTRILEWGKEFIYIVSQAEKAFNYIMDADI